MCSGPLGVVLTDPRALFDLADPLGDRFAHLAGHQLGVLVDVVSQRLCEVRGQLLTGLYRTLPPRVDGLVDIRERRFDGRLVVWVVGFDTFVGCWVDSFEHHSANCRSRSVTSR